MDNNNNNNSNKRMNIITTGFILFLMTMVANNGNNLGVNAEEAFADLSSGEAITVNQCPMSETKTKPTPEAKLQYCTDYTSNACCTPQEDLEVEKEINNYWRSLTGHCPGCLANAKRFHCAYRCSPDQRNFINPIKQPAGVTKKAGQIKMCSQFCKSWFKSCVNTSIAERFSSNANSFCVSMIDSATGSSIELSMYSCFNDADAANTCSGDTVPPLPKNETNLWFIFTSLILGIVAVLLIITICNTETNDGAARIKREWEALDGSKDPMEDTRLITGSSINN